MNDPIKPHSPQEAPSPSVQAIIAEMERTAAAKKASPPKPDRPWRTSRTWKICLGVGVAMMFLPLVLFVTPDAPVASEYEGYVDPGRDDAVIGWAWDKAHPDKPVSVEIDDGLHPKVTVLANLPREDLRKLQMGNGRHGFHYVVPKWQRDGRTYNVNVRFVDTQRVLENSPRKITYAKDEDTPKVR
jgi:hypothetical protein